MSALIIKSKYTKPRFNGQRISFDNNGCILINNINFKNKKTRTKLTLTGSTVFGLTLKEFRLYSIKININDEEDTIKEKALAEDNVKNHTEGKEIIKVIVIKINGPTSFRAY